MKIRAAVLCDFATIRQGLLTIVSAGVSRVHSPMFPCPLGVHVALMLELSPDELGINHEVRVVLTSPTSAVKLAEVGASFEIGGPVSAGEHSLLPLVFNMRFAPINAPGQYDLKVIAGRETEVISIWYVDEPPSAITS